MQLYIKISQQRDGWKSGKKATLAEIAYFAAHKHAHIVGRIYI